MSARLARRICQALLLCGVTSAAVRAQTLGTIAFPNSGNAAAQPHFIRGVLYLHSFEYESAAAAFRAAQQADPGFALAYWGEAMTHTHPVWNEQNLTAARTILARLGPDAVGSGGALLYLAGKPPERFPLRRTRARRIWPCPT